MSESTGKAENVIEDPAVAVQGTIEVHDNWYVVVDAKSQVALMVGTWLPPPNLSGVAYAKLTPDEARAVMNDLVLRTLGREVHHYQSARVAHNNRLLAIGPWLPEMPIAGIQFDRLMPDQARELIGELVERSKGPSLVGAMELKG